MLADVLKRRPWSTRAGAPISTAAFGTAPANALALENPPLPIVSDMVRFRVRTNWTKSISESRATTST